MSGLSDNGFSRKLQTEIISDLQKLFQKAYGTINLDGDSIFGLLIGVISQGIIESWEELENTYYAMYPASAEGFSLDNVCALSGITRLQATSTIVLVAIWGTSGTAVSTGFKGSVEDTGEVFQLTENITLGQSAAAGATIKVIASIQGDTYTLTINGNNYQYDNAGGDPVETIASALAASVDSGESNVTATADGADIHMVSTDGETAFSIGALSESHFSLEEIASFGNFAAVNTGPVLALAETLTQIETPVSGVDSIINYIDGIIGRNTETDVELRIRRAESIALVGSGTIDSIRAHLLQDVANVIAVMIEENRTDTPIGDLPAHAFECIVQGGADQDIAEKIWELKPAGIETHGDESVFVVDSQGTDQEVKFSRPNEILVWIDVQMTENTEEEFPENGEDAVRAAILEAAEGISVGDDVIIQKFFSAIYSISGIATATITWETGVGPFTPPHGNTGNITIANNEIALFDLSRITVTMN